LKYLIVLLFIIPLVSNAQTINGFVYDHETTVKGVKLLNTTQNILAYSDDKGQFKIKARLKDTLVISSFFHATKTIVVTPYYFEKEVVIELRKTTNELDEVEINKILDKAFDSIVFKVEAKNKIANDIKNRPYLYGLQPSINIDFIAIGKLIGSLFKTKNKPIEITYITSEDLVTLFENNRLFNQVLLISELKIDKELHFLFFEYCSAQHINKILITQHRDIELLDYLVVSGAAFNTLVENHVND
jgi:hypothetical protein